MAATQPTTAEIRPALEHALGAARSWGKSRSSPLPGRVQDLVASRRRTMPDHWLTTMRRALEHDAGFRSEIAAAADEESLGRLAWLWLARPDGWSDELADVLASAREVANSEKDDRLAASRLSSLERQLARSDTTIERLKAVNETQAGEIAKLRKDLHASVEQRRAAADEARLAVSQADRLTRSASGAERDAAEARRRAHRVRADLERAAARAGVLQDELGAVRAELEKTRSERDEAQATADHVAGEIAKIRQDAGDALGRAATNAAAMAAGLDQARVAVAGSAPLRSATRAAPKSRSAQLNSRPVLGLPPGIFDDSAEAAEYLLSAPRVHLVVDGYNVALTSWPGSDLPALRDRLVSSLAELVLRQRMSIEVFFDGEGDGGRQPPPPAARSLMTVIFSASGVDADDEILDAVDRFDGSRPVVVATDDRAVRDAARIRRAAVISVSQLLAVLGRHTPLR